jgi:hypothetical protein
VTRRCAKCHSGDAPAAGLDVSRDLSDLERLAAIGRLLADDPAKRMPKGIELDADERGLLIQELAKNAEGRRPEAGGATPNSPNETQEPR